MDGIKRLWGRRLVLAVGLAGAAAASMGVSRCGGSSSSTITVSGSTLTIYASAPAGSQSQDLVDAEELALKQAGPKAGPYTIRFTVLGRRPPDNARAAIQDKSAIAYIGELQPGVSADSMGITEDQDLLQVSPADTAIALTRSTPAVPGAPKHYYEDFSGYGRTFARVVPSAGAEAGAQVQEMRSLGVNKLYVADDGSDYGRAIAYAVRRDASSHAIAATAGPPSAAGVARSGADALFFGGSGRAAAQAAGLFAQTGSRLKLFAPSALASAALPAGTYVSQPGFLPRNLPAAAEARFVKPFEAAYGHLPATGAIFGYEAMSALLAVLHGAGAKANNRSQVVHDFFHLSRRQSVLGAYSIDGDGDTSLAPFVFSRARSGTLVPYKFVQASP